MTIKDDREAFLSRWSRLKIEAREDPEHEAPEKADESKAPPELPPVENLNYDSDFKAFMDKRVDQRLRRLALKKLFQDPHFNVPDGLDDYAEDYTLLEDLPEDMVALQQHARRVLFGPDEKKEPSATDDPSVAPPGEQSGEQVASDTSRVTPADDAGGVRAEEGGAATDPDNQDERRQV